MLCFNQNFIWLKKIICLPNLFITLQFEESKVNRKSSQPAKTKRKRNIPKDFPKSIAKKKHCLCFEIFHVFSCTKCDHLFSRHHDLTRHLKTCTNEVCETFPGGIYKIPPAVYEKLDDIGISIPLQDSYFPFFSCFNFECHFSQENLLKNSLKLT